MRCLRPALTACGYEVLSAETGRSALHAIASRAPDLVLLDLGLPDMDGKSVITQAGAFSKAPIVVLSARDREAEKISALDAGAVDYVEKPFAIGELMARLRAALRHAAREVGKIERVERGGLVIDLARRLVTKHGATVKLTPKEYGLLAISGAWRRTPAHPPATAHRRLGPGASRRLAISARLHRPVAEQNRGRSGKSAADPDGAWRRLSICRGGILISGAHPVFAFR